MMYGNGWSGNGGCAFGFGGGYFSIWHLLIVIGIIIIIFSIVASRKSKTTLSSDAVDKLKVLYINGEISEEEFLKRKNVIDRK